MESLIRDENSLASDRPISPNQMPLEKKPPELNSPEQKPPEQMSTEGKPLEVTPEKRNLSDTKKEKKDVRRRSSIGLSILNSFMAPGTEDIPSPMDLKPRPKRAVQVKYEQKKPVVPVIKRAKPIRYSFDVGECVAVKPCLKRPGVKRHVMAVTSLKSLTQQAAQKVINKYKNSRNSGEACTPSAEKSSKLKFHNICSIRVITPRPSYDPFHLAMPDDDEVAANRERLSTVDLVLTPTSQAQIDSIRDKDVVQFNAQMVFGDGDPLPTTSSSGESVVETVVETAESSVASEKELESVEVRKKSTRRKSLIKGSASPMKSPAKIEKPRSIDNDDELVESKTTRKSRRSVRVNYSDTIEKPEESDDSELQEREKCSKKKRVLVPEPEKVEPNPKRSRRKSGFLKQETATEEEKPEEKREKKNVPIHSFFTPKSSKNTEVETKKKEEETRKAEEKARKAEEDARKEEEDAKKARKKARRSSAYFGTSERKKKTVREVSEEPDIVVVSKCETSSKSSDKVDFEVISETRDIETASSSSSSSFKIHETVIISTSSNSEASVISKPKKALSDTNLNEPSTSSASKPSASAPKLFSLFSPKPKPKLDLNTSQNPISLSDSPIVPKIKEIPKKSIGVKRKEHWGDAHPENYEFMIKMPSQPSLFEEDSTYAINEKLFKSRSLDESIFVVDTADSELRPIESEFPNLLIPTQSTENVTIEKLSVPDKSCPTTLYPPDMKSLVEGADEEEMIGKWLKKWKRRVRKDLEREFEKEKEKKNGGSKKGRKKKRDREDEDSDYDYAEELYDDDLENPLVLIGPTGVGKTALIRAVAKEANMRIISIGPETERSGAEIKKKLQESIRSHRVDQQPTRFETTFFKTISSQKGATPKKQPKDYIQSLVVFEHVDVFFETADRFGVNGLLEIVNESAVPIIFTCQNDWPRRTAQAELKRKFLEVHLGRNELKVQKYVQRVVYSCRDVIIDNSTISKLSKSVNHDLQALLRQAHIYSLAPTKSFPLTSRYLVSSGFDEKWEGPRGSSSKVYERMEHLMEEYRDVLPDVIATTSHPEVRRIWDSERKKFAVKQSRYSENLQSVYEALYGRHSKKNLILDVIPFLVTIDQIEKRRIAGNRRHFHRLIEESAPIPMDGHTLCDVVGVWSFNRH